MSLTRMSLVVIRRNPEPSMIERQIATSERKDVEAVDEHAGGPEVGRPVRLPAPEVADPERVARLGHGFGASRARLSLWL